MGRLQFLLAVGACSWTLACGTGAATPPQSAEGTTTAEPGEAAPTDRPSAVAAARHAKAPAISTCWSKGAADNLDLKGVVELAIAVDDSGQPSKVTVTRDEPDDRSLTKCLVELWSGYNWPASAGGPEPITLSFEFEKPEYQYRVSSEHALVHTMPDKRSTVKLLFDRVNSGNPAAGFTIMTLKPGIRVPLHRHSTDELLFALSGSGHIFDYRGQERGLIRVDAGSAVHIPAGTPHGFLLDIPKDVVVVQMYAPSGPEQRFKGLPSTATTPVSAKEAKRARKLLPIEVRKMSARGRAIPRPKVRATEIVPGAIRTTLFKLGNKRQGGVGTLRVDAGATIPKRSHDDRSEYLYVVEGRADLTIDGTSISVGPGDGIQIPPGTEHEIAVGPDASLSAVQFFAGQR